MGNIHRLSDTLRDRIAAGEVIQRPANVLKELVENSVDAGATRIAVRAEQGGIALIEVSDNGQGMGHDDLLLAMENHATSKIADSGDLDAIHTLGFRGEALASVRASASVQITSSLPDEGQARMIAADPATRELVVQPASRGPGTTVVVRDLFLQLPARRKFLKSERTEVGRLTELMQQYRLAFPEIGWSWTHNGKQAWELGPESEEARVARWIGEKESGHIVRVQETGPLFSMRFYGAQPRHTIGRGDRIWLFMNGRPIRDRNLVHAVVQAYARWIPSGRYPVGVLFLDVDPGWVDVNVHPAKTEVRFAEARLIHDFVVKSLRRGLEEQAASVSAVSAYTNLPVQEDPSSGRTWSGSGSSIGYDRGRAAGAGSAASYPTAVPQAGTTRVADAARGWQQEASQSTLQVESDSHIRILGQVMAKYIVAEVAGSLVLVDQHAAHEALNYHRIRGSIVDGKAGGTQMLLAPIELVLAPEASEALERSLATARAFGFDLSVSECTVSVRGVPDWSTMDAEVFLADWSAELVAGQADFPAGDPLELFAAERACKASLKANDRLTVPEMLHLLEELFRLPDGAACPHGRPTRIVYDEADLDREFQRLGH